MATPPTFTLYAEVANWFTKGTAARTVAGVSWSASDDIYVIGGTGDGETVFTGVPTATGLTFTQIAFITGGVGAGTTNYLWVAHAAGTGSSVTVSSSTLDDSFAAAGIAVLVVSGSAGAGTPVTGFTGTAESLSVTRVGDNSGVLFANFDWTAQSPAPTAWTPAGQTQRTAVTNAADYSIEIATWGDQGAAGTTSYGQTGTTTSGKWSKIAVEIKGAAGGAATDISTNPLRLQPKIIGNPFIGDIGRGPGANVTTFPRQPAIPMVLWYAADEAASAVDSRTQTGSCGVAAAGTSTSGKIAVERGNNAAAAATTAVEKKLAPALGTTTAAPATTVVAKKIAVERGANGAAATATAVEKKVAPEVGTATAAALASGTESASTAGTAERGTATASPAATAVEKKVAVQTGSCVAAAAGTGLVRKIAPQAGAATAAAAGTAVEKKVGATRGPSAAASAATATEKKVAIGRGATTGAAGPAAVDKKVALERGTAAAGATGTATKVTGERGVATAAIATYATDKKVAIQTGICAAASMGSSTQAKRVSSIGTCAVAPAATGLPRRIVRQLGSATAAPCGLALPSKRIGQSGAAFAAVVGLGAVLPQYVPGEGTLTGGVRPGGAITNGRYAGHLATSYGSGVFSEGLYGPEGGSTSGKVLTGAGTAGGRR